MTNQLRDEEIKSLRKAGQTYRQISETTSLSAERVRQICNDINLQGFYEKLEEDYKDIISEADYNWLKMEIEELSKPDRKKRFVIRRRILIKYLHDNLKMSFYQIGRVLQRHHTSIVNLYKQIS